MKSKSETERVISEILDVVVAKQMCAREKRLFRESLRNLVRLAKSELVLEMKNNVNRLTGLTPSRHPSAANCDTEPYQRRFEFNPFE